jgi:L-gulonate 3-dehydrogenase
MKNIAIIGSGLIGQGWATVFAQAGFHVAMYDTSAQATDAALKAMETRLFDMAAFNLIASSDAPEILSRIHGAQTLDVDFKREITTNLDAIAGSGVPIASSTSGIAASRYSEDIAGRHRCLVVHPINPPHLIPAVEIVPTPWTKNKIVSQVKDLMTQCQRETIVLNKEIDGFVVNRLQGALLQEAFNLIGSGIVSAEDLDKAVCDGLGLRWSFMGPMQTIHLNAPGGIVQYVERYGDMYRNFSLGDYDTLDWSQIVDDSLGIAFEQKTPVSDIPGAQAQRDRTLMALLRHKAETHAASDE